MGESLLGNRIREVRESKKLNQGQFASLIGVDRTTLASWEGGRRIPNIDDIITVAKVGCVSLDWLSGRINVSIDQARDYTNQEWYDLIDLASDYNITPEKLRRLISAALALDKS